jgi:hypothetical protein
MCVSGNARKRFVVVVETEVKHDKPSTPVTEVGGEMNNHTVTKFRELEMDKNTIYNSAAVSMSEFSDLLSWANEFILFLTPVVGTVLNQKIICSCFARLSGLARTNASREEVMSWGLMSYRGISKGYFGSLDSLVLKF